MKCIHIQFEGKMKKTKVMKKEKVRFSKYSIHFSKEEIQTLKENLTRKDASAYLSKVKRDRA